MIKYLEFCDIIFPLISLPSHFLVHNYIYPNFETKKLRF